MDIEQYEFNAMDKFMQDFAGKPLPVGQFLVEIHLMGLQNELHRPNFPEFMEWWERLEACGLRPVWTELNLLAVTLHAEDSLPRCSEVSVVFLLRGSRIAANWHGSIRLSTFSIQRMCCCTSRREKN
jgi:hypothetical protein